MAGDPLSVARLRPCDLGAGPLHGAQALAVVFLANRFSLPVRATYTSDPPPEPGIGTQTVTLFNLNFSSGIAAFFALSAVARLVVAGPAWSSSRKQLAKHRNLYRWLGHSLSASIMIVLVGIDDIAALVALVGINAAMTAFGWLQEPNESRGGSLDRSF